MFRKRRHDNQRPPAQAPGGAAPMGGGALGSATPVAGRSQPGQSETDRPEASRPDAAAVLNRPAATPSMPEGAARRAPGGPATRAAVPRSEAEPESKKLIVGRDISLAGEIRSCDKLVVEGEVEADLADSLSLEVGESGVFKGTAVIDNADIAGRFEGELTVRERLYVRATGDVHGTIRYGQLQIEQGGRLGGTLEELAESEARAPRKPSRAAETADTPQPSEAVPARPSRSADGGGRQRA